MFSASDRRTSSARGSVVTFCRGASEVGAEDLRDVAEPQELTGDDEPFAGGGGHGHREQMRRRDIAYVHDLERESRQCSRRPVEETREHVQRAQRRRRQRRTENGRREHRGQLHRRRLIGDEVPSRPFGQHLRASIGREAGLVGVRPTRFVDRARQLRRVRCRGRARRRHDHPRDLCASRRGQDAQRAFPRRSDERLRIVRVRGERRRDMQHVVATGHGCVPSFVHRQIGDDETQRVDRNRPSRHRLADGGLLLPRPHCGDHVVTRFEQLNDAPSGDEPRSARHQHRRHAPGLSRGTDSFATFATVSRRVLQIRRCGGRR